MTVKYTNEQIAEAVLASHSFAEVTRVLGMGRSGSASSHIKRRIENLKLDTAHFTGQGWTKGRSAGNRKTAMEILVYDPNRQVRVKADKLRRSLIEIGREYACVECSNTGEWRGKKLTLETDHIDGNAYDNRPENLRFLCPNCHDQTPTNGRQKRLLQ